MKARFGIGAVLAALVLGATQPAGAALFDHRMSAEEAQSKIDRLPPESRSRTKAMLYSELGTDLYRKNRMFQATDAFEAALENPTSKSLRRHIYLFLGKSYESSGRLDRAILAYEQAVRYDRGNSRRHRDLAGLYAQAKLYPQAIASYQACLKRDPHDAIALFGLGRVWRKVGLYERAEANLKEAARLGHDEHAVNEELSLVFEGEGRIAEAMDFWMRFLQRPEKATDTEAARQVYLAALAGNPKVAEEGIDRLKAAGADAETVSLYENLIELLRLDPTRLLALQSAGPGVRSLVEPLITK